MNRWTRRIRGAIGMGLIWAASWALAGAFMEVITGLVPGLDGALVDIWVTALAVPGFLGGMAFSLVLGVAGRRRRFDEVSLTGFTLWGALGGLLVSTLIVIPSSFSAASVLAAGVVTCLCAGSAAGSLALARRAESLDAGPVVLSSSMPAANRRSSSSGEKNLCQWW